MVPGRYITIFKGTCDSKLFVHSCFLVLNYSRFPAKFSGCLSCWEIISLELSLWNNTPDSRRKQWQNNWNHRLAQHNCRHCSYPYNLYLRRKEIEFTLLSHSIYSCHSIYWKRFSLCSKVMQNVNLSSPKSGGRAIARRTEVTCQFILSIIMNSRTFNKF